MISEDLLEELRRYYDREEDRRKSFDSKSATLLGFSATATQILVAVLTFVASQRFLLRFSASMTIFLIIAMAFFTTASMTLLACLRARKYEEILPEGDLERMKNETNEEQRRIIAERLTFAVYKNKEENDRKNWRFELGFIFIGGGVITILMIGLIVFFEIVRFI